MMPGEDRPEHQLLQTLAAEKSLYISGPPGSGKTTFCRWLTLAVCQGEFPAHPIAPPEGFQETFPEPLRGRLPLLIRLREFWECVAPVGRGRGTDRGRTGRGARTVDHAQEVRRVGLAGRQGSPGRRRGAADLRRRGRGGSMWGANSLNGVINIITRDPEEGQDLMVTGKAGSKNYRETVTSYSDTIAEKFSYRVTGGYREDQGNTGST